MRIARFFTGEYSAYDSGYQRRLRLGVDFREHIENQTVTGHGVQDAGQGEYRAQQTV